MPLKERVKVKSNTTTTTSGEQIKNWFHDRLGKFAGDDGGAILELYLLRREMALGQRILLKRRQSCTEPWVRFTLAEGVGMLSKLRKKNAA